MKSEETEVFVFPASFAQQRLWFLDQLVPGNSFYNVATALRLTGSLNLTALQQTFNEIVRRHESLRTTFIMVEGKPAQVIAPTLTISIPVIDLRNFPATKRETEVRRIVTIEAQYPFNLAKDSLLRVTLLQLGESEYVLLLNLHHIVADGWSIGVLIRELGTLYTAFVENKPSPLLQLPIQYADFAEWQREWLQGEVLETQLAYWRQQLDGISVLNLPTDKPRPAIQTYQGAKQFITLPHSLSEKLQSLSQQQNATLFMILLAAFKTLLYHYTGQEDIAIGSPIANRNRSEIEGLIGFFVNSLVLRTDLSGNITFLELISRVKKVAMGAYAHQDLPFEKLVEELHPERDLSRNPLFQVSFTVQNTPVETLELPELSLSLLEFDSGTAKLDLEFHFWEDLKTIKGQAVYSTDLFDNATITRMLGHFQTLLEAIVTNPQKRLNELPILTKSERHQLLHNQSKIQNLKSKISQCFHQLFEAQVEQTPNAIALLFEDVQTRQILSLTYHELNIRANQLAHHLQKIGVVPDVIVGICLERSLEMIVGLLAIFKAGGAYLPLDPTYPQERLKFMLEDAKVSVLLTHSVLAPLFQGGSGEISIVCVDKDRKAIASQRSENPISSVTLDNLAYIIYTSGSTGKPKGVLLQHRGLYNLAEAQIEIFNLQPSHRVLQFASLSFDASIFEIVMALRTGATLYLAKKESLLPGQDLIKLLRDRTITHITLPPAVLALLPKEELPALQTIICAGESCSQDILKHWASNRRFFNAYGPTEATVWATIAEITDNSVKPPIGRPIPNVQIYILNKHLQLLPIGIPGELYIGGDGLARGYLNRPDLTTEKFISNPFKDKEGTRLYKTGDLARYQPDGNIEFLGRIDDQVKIRGYRIELGEIEAVLSQHPLVREVIVIALDDAPLNKRLIAYLIPHKEQTPTSIELRDFLKKKLPEYMLPSAFITLDSLPLTPNGKVDRRNLPAPDDTVSKTTETAFVAPHTPTELSLANIWNELLNLEHISINDNFFDLGGNSLLAIRLMDKINQQFKRELPLSALFLNPTIKSLAITLNSEADFLSWSPLVAIQPAGSKPPFFCVHPIFGVVFPYYELAYHLGRDQPFYGLQPIGIDGKKSPLTSIEDMAAYYIKALRTVQPKGPYYLGGWSFGGLVAFEMAQQLQRSGDKVALLAVLDTLAPISRNKPSLWDGYKFIITTVTRSLWSFFIDYFKLLTNLNQQESDKFSKINPKLNNIIRWLRNNFSFHSVLGQMTLMNLMPPESRQKILSEVTVRPLIRIFQANTQATLSYVPQVYSNRITVFRSSQQMSSSHQDKTLGWGNLTESDVNVYRVAGNHLTMLRKPNVQVLSKQLSKAIYTAGCD